MLRRLSLQDFVIVERLELEFGPGFTVLTGETGAGKSILIEALQLCLGQRADAVVVRDGAPHADLSAEFDLPPGLHAWLDEAGFDQAEGSLLLRRRIDAQGKSRAWINGHSATATQLKTVAEQVLDIHGQHAWQSLTRAAAVREVLDAFAAAPTEAVRQAHSAWKHAQQAFHTAQDQAQALAREREGWAWQVGELQRLAPGPQEWAELNADHQRLGHAQSLLDAVAAAHEALDGEEQSARRQLAHAQHRLNEVLRHDPALAGVMESIQSAQALLDDAAHTLSGYAAKAQLDPERLQALEERLSAWMGLARRLRHPPAELHAVWEAGQAQLQRLEQASDVEALERAALAALAAYQQQAQALSQARQQAAPRLARLITQSMQELGMSGGQFHVALLPESEPQSWGQESVEFQVAGHAGSTPRPLAKVASGGELSRLALAIAVATARHQPQGVGSLIFDEIDAGVGGEVANTVGRLLKALGQDRQVLAITHLAQVASCADHHHVVSKHSRQGRTLSHIQPVQGEERVSELARMLGNARLDSSQALAHKLLQSGQT